MIPIAVPNLCGNEAKYLQECIESTFVSSVGPFVDRFEDMICNASGNDFAVSTSSGTTALHLALTTLGVKHNDLVILPALTFIASANAISHCGAAPWLFDVCKDTWTLDPNLLEEKLQKETELSNGTLIHIETGRKVAAILPVYMLGLPADMKAISRIAKKYNLPIVADAACALGTSTNNDKIGKLGADLTVYSFNGNKTITAGGGGAVSGDNEQVLKLAKHLSTTARVGSGYDHDMVGFNYRITNIQAAVGCAQLELLDTFVKQKNKISNTYTNAFKHLAECENFPKINHVKSTCWLSGVLLNKTSKVSPNDFRAELIKNGIDARPFWKPIHLQKPYVEAPRTQMPICEDIWDRIIPLPCSTHLTSTEQDLIINTVLHFFEH